MPIQLSIWERRDNGDREVMGNTALAICRFERTTNGITSAKFYWSGSERIVFLTEGEGPALSGIGESYPPDYYKAGFVLADNARVTMNLRLTDPRESLETYRAAGR